jgi:hypothetical protein
MDIDCRVPGLLQKHRLSIQERYRLSEGSVLAAGCVAMGMAAILFIAFLEFVHSTFPNLLLPREHAD